jgi:hypothetical protein
MPVVHARRTVLRHGHAVIFEPRLSTRMKENGARAARRL